MRINTLFRIIILFASFIMLGLVIISPILELSGDLTAMFFISFALLFIGAVSIK